MPTQVQWRRGTTTQHSTFTGAVGEVTVDTTLNVVRVHDGTTAGGWPVMGSSGGTVNGSLSVIGPLSVNGSISITGNTLLTQSNTYSIGNSTLYLANTFTQNTITNYISQVYTYQSVAVSDPSYSQGLLWYSTTGKAYRYWTDVSGLEIDVGQQLLIPVVNQYSGSIIAGTPVKYSGSTLSNSEYIPYITLAEADIRTDLEPFAGLAACSMASGAKGYVVADGIVKNVNTSAFTVGNIVYVSNSTAGALTATKPTPGSNGYAIVKAVGYVIVSDASVGKIVVRIRDEFATNYSTNSVFYSKSNEIYQDNSNFVYNDSSKLLTVTNINASTALTSSGTLGVTGATTLNSTLGVSGATTLSSTLGVTGATTLNSTLYVSGTTTLNSTLGVSSSGSFGGSLSTSSNFSASGSGSFGSTCSAPTFSATSDKTLKKNIKTLKGSLDIVKQMRGVSFAWKNNNIKQIGLIAQEVKELVPEVVTENDKGVLGVAYQNIVALLIEAVKEQQEQIDTLKKQLDKK